MTRNSFIILTVIMTGLFVSCKPIYKCGEPKPEKKLFLPKNINIALNNIDGSMIEATSTKTGQTLSFCIQKEFYKKFKIREKNLIHRSLKDQNGKTKLIKTDAAYGNNDAFYDARGSYSFLYTCNTWTNDGLKVAGQKAAFWTATDFGIFQHYK